MTSPLVRVLAQALAGPGAPGRGDGVLVAASGGPDSTALAAALARAAPEHGLDVTLGHVDHALRGGESAGDRAAVEALATRLGVACVVADAPVPPGADLERRARDARHRALRELAARSGATTVALGHTEDDQVETVLLRLLRGAGRGGLGGMAARRGRLWRPLLAATRADVRRYLADEDLPFRLDRSNADLRHARNRLRRLVVPLLAREFNPRLGAAIAALAARLRDEDAFLDGAAASRGPAYRRGDALATGVAAEPPALARRIVRAWLHERGWATPTARDVERALALAAGTRPGSLAVAGPARIVRQGDVLAYRRGRGAVATPFRRTLDAAGVVDGPAGAWRLTLSTPRAARDGDLADLSAWRARFDADRLALPLVVRSVEPGDRIAVPGVGTRKLQDVLVDAKIPREARASVPLVVDDAGTILWVAGVVRGAGARLGPDTRRVVDMELRLA